MELPGGGYYACKDYGLRHCASDVVLFIDSDAIPEEGWLNALMEAINTPKVNLTVGATYIDTRDLLGKAFALNWFFPLRPNTGALAQGRDRVIRERYLGNSWQQHWLTGCVRLPRHLLGSVWKTIRGRRLVGLSWWQTPVAIAIAWLYHFLYWLGEMGEHLGLKRLRAIRV